MASDDYECVTPDAGCRSVNLTENALVVELLQPGFLDYLCQPETPQTIKAGRLLYFDYPLVSLYRSAVKFTILDFQARSRL